MQNSPKLKKEKSGINNFLAVLEENYQTQIAGLYNVYTTDEERKIRNAVIEEYKDLIEIYNHKFPNQKPNNMQNIPEGLIPYNHELYLTGKYIAETRGGFRPPQVVKMEGETQPIVYVDDDKDISCCNENGNWSTNKEVSEYDLFLRPKMVKKWEVVIVCDDEDKADYLYNQLTDAIVREVEVNEE